MFGSYDENLFVKYALRKHVCAHGLDGKDEIFAACMCRLFQILRVSVSLNPTDTNALY